MIKISSFIGGVLGTLVVCIGISEQSCISIVFGIVTVVIQGYLNFKG